MPIGAETPCRFTHLAPLSWQHINLTGDYIWAEPPRLDGDGFQPLRASIELIAA